MESGQSCESGGPQEEKVLETLASIRNEVSCVLKHIQAARDSAADCASKKVEMNSAAERKDTGSTNLPVESPVSRDDVKAQREAKKAAKAARKGKGVAVGETPGSSQNGQVPKSAPLTELPKPESAQVDAKGSISKAAVTEQTPAEVEEGQKSKAQLKAERRALQEAQRAAKAAGVSEKPGKKPGGEKASDKNAPSTNKAESPAVETGPVTSNTAQKIEKGPQKPAVPQGLATPVKVKESMPAKTPLNGSVLKTPIIASKGVDIQENHTTLRRHIKPSTLYPAGSKIHGLFRWVENKSSIDGRVNDSKFIDIDPIFSELGTMYSTYVIRGSNHRTIALLNVVKDFIKKYRTPEGKGFKHDLSSKLKICFDKLKLYRPFAVGMTTAVDGLNGAIRHLEEGLSDEEYRELLEDYCDRFIEEKIDKAVEAIAQQGVKKIEDGDTILAFSLTDVIFHVLQLAGEMGKKFHLVLATTNSDMYLKDYKHLKDCMGAEVLQENVRVSCVNISSIMSFISSVNKVFLGGHALFTTGGVMAHAGSSTIALCAIQHNIPTLFFCETYKFCDKSPTDAFYKDVFLENIAHLTPFHDSCDDETNESVPNSRRHTGVETSEIPYDLTPVNLVTCVITDIDMLPSSSVPVVLRVQESRPLTKLS